MFVYAWASVLNDVITIHRTGKKNTIPTTQPTMPHVRLLPRRFLRGPVNSGAAVVAPGGAVMLSALVIMPPVRCRRTR